jgi:hypothetical protein
LRLDILINITKFVVAFLCCAGAAAAGTSGAGVAGAITDDATWSGDVYLAGDLYIAPGATLTLEPGTRVTVSREDALSKGILIHGDSRRVEVEVAGTLALNGTPEARVVFVPEADGSPDEAWSGLELKKGGLIEAEYVWLVGGRGGFPKRVRGGESVYAVNTTRRKGAPYWPVEGHNVEGQIVYFYPDGTLLPKEEIEAYGGKLRWGVAAGFAAVGAGIAYHVALGMGLNESQGRPSTAESLSPLAIPVAFFAIGYFVGRAAETDVGVWRAQMKWFEKYPDFTPPFYYP